MDNLEQFNSLLTQFGALVDEHLELDEENSCSFVVDDEVIVNLQYLLASDMILIWTTVGELPEDDMSGERARFLLEKQDFWQGTRGFTLGLDPEEPRLLCHDLQDVNAFDSVDTLAAWIDTLVEVTQSLRDEIAQRFPLQKEPEDEFEEDDGFDQELDNAENRGPLS